MDFPRLLSVEPRPAYRLFLRYADGVEGEIDLTPDIEAGGVFTAIAAIEQFNQVKVVRNGHAIAWSHGIDICPSSAYLEVRGLSYEQWKALDQAPVSHA